MGIEGYSEDWEINLPQASERPLAETGRVFHSVPSSVGNDLVGLLFFLLPPELDTVDDAATSTVDRATPCRLSRELSSTSTAACSTALTPAVPWSSAVATATFARFPDRLRGGGGGGGGDDGAGSTGAALAGDAGGGEASSDGARRFAAELRLVSTIAPARRGRWTGGLSGSPVPDRRREAAGRNGSGGLERNFAAGRDGSEMPCGGLWG